MDHSCCRTYCIPGTAVAETTSIETRTHSTASQSLLLLLLPAATGAVVCINQLVSDRCDIIGIRPRYPHRFPIECRNKCCNFRDQNADSQTRTLLFVVASLAGASSRHAAGQAQQCTTSGWWGRGCFAFNVSAMPPRHGHGFDDELLHYCERTTENY